MGTGKLLDAPSGMEPIVPVAARTVLCIMPFSLICSRAMADAHPTNAQSKHLPGYPFSTLP